MSDCETGDSDGEILPDSITTAECMYVAWHLLGQIKDLLLTILSLQT